MTQYFTRTTQVSLKPGEKLGFTTGKGYYAIPAPPPKAAPPAQQKPAVTPTAASPASGPARAPAAATPTPATSAATPAKPAAARPPATLATTQPTAATTTPPPAPQPVRRAAEHPIQPSPVTRAHPVVANHPQSHTTITKAHATSEIAKLTTTHGTITNITIHDAAPMRDWRTALELALASGTGPKRMAGTTAPTQETSASDQGKKHATEQNAAASSNRSGTKVDPKLPSLSDAPGRSLEGTSGLHRDPQASRILHPLSDAHLKTPPKVWQTSAGRERYAAEYFKVALNLDSYQVAALVGNLSLESTASRRPHSPRLVANLGEYGGGSGFGIAQWTLPARKGALHAFARDNRLSVSNFGAQLAYVAYELVSDGQNYAEATANIPQTGALIAKGTLDALRNARTLNEAVAIVQVGFETSGGKDGKDYRRVPYFPTIDPLLRSASLLPMTKVDGFNPSFYARVADAKRVLKEIGK